MARKNDLQPDKEQNEKVIQIRRVTKVVKGGKRLAFRAAVVVGDRKGKVAIALGKSREVPSSIRKAIDRGNKHLKLMRITGGTIPHEVWGRAGATRVLLRPAPPGTGVIAGGSVRTVLEMVGLTDIVSKSHGSNNSINMARATLDALDRLLNADIVSARRGVAVGRPAASKVEAPHGA
jgi:small subunit ribosomal protein S5